MKSPQQNVKKVKTLKSSPRFYALLCDSGMLKDEPLICGVYPSLKEAREVANLVGVKECVCKHRIQKCAVEITFQGLPLPVKGKKK